MGSTITVSIRSLAVSAAVAIAVVMAYAIGSAQSGGTPAFAAGNAVPGGTPTIVMTGSGEATGIPDQLTFSLSIGANAADVSTALASSNRVTRDVLQAVRDQGIDVEDIQTTGLSIDANYDYSGEGPPVLTGYRASQKLSVLVRSLPDAGSTISAAVEAGGNAVRLSGVQLKIGDPDALMREARDAAFAEAKAKAEQYAAATGRQLGDVTSVREVAAKSPAYQDLAYRSAGLVAAEDSAVPIKAGSAELEVTVSVVWSFV